MALDLIENKKRSWVGTVITLVFVLILVAFVWRVVYYTNQLHSGQTDLSQLNFDNTVSTISKFAKNPVPSQVVDVVTKDRPSLGTKGAPVTIVEFADFGCPFSRQSSFILRSLAAAYPDKIYFQYREFPIVDLHPIAEKAAEAAECANEQGKFWEYHDKLYQNQVSLDDNSFDLFATSLNLNLPQFQKCYTSSKYLDVIRQDMKDGLAAGVQGTPTFFINGNRIPGSIPQDILEKVILNVSAEKK